MKDFIKKRLHEHWGWMDEPKITSPLSKELEDIANSGYDVYQIQRALEDLENKYAEKYAEYPGDSYGVIDAIKQVIPTSLARIYDDMHPKVRYENINEVTIEITPEMMDMLHKDGECDCSGHKLIYKESVNEDAEPELKFNKDGRFNKEGANTIYMDDNPIVDFGVGGIGTLKINGEEIPNALYLKGGYNASEQGKGYGSMGLKFIFQKLPKIMNIVIQCYDTACPFWFKQGGKEIATKEMGGGHMLRTLRISRDSFE
jgi:hypothetical protein